MKKCQIHNVQLSLPLISITLGRKGFFATCCITLTQARESPCCVEEGAEEGNLKNLRKTLLPTKEFFKIKNVINNAMITVVKYRKSDIV